MAALGRRRLLMRACGVPGRMRQRATLIAVGTVALCGAMLLTACAQPPSSSPPSGVSGPSLYGSPTTGTPQPCDAATQWKPPSDNVQLDDFALTGPGAGWAVGAYAGDPRTPGYQGPTGVIYHLSGGQWQRLPQTYPGEELTSVAMDSPTDGWIVASGAQMFLLHYDGSQWHKVDVPAIDAAFGPPGGVTVPGFGQGKVQTFGSTAWYYAATDNPLNPSDPSSRTTAVAILRYQHGAWTAIPAPNVPGSVTLFDFAAVSADEAWLLGEDYGSNLTTLLYHYANGQWSQQPLSFPGGSGQHLWMLAPTNGWTFVGAGGSPTMLLHYDGSTWTRLDLTQLDHLIGTVQYMTAIGAPVPGTTWFDVYLQANQETIANTPTLVAYSAGTWRRVAWPYPGQEPSVIAGASDGTLWGVGNIGHQEGCAPAMVTMVEQGVFYQHTQGQWHETMLP